MHNTSQVCSPPHRRFFPFSHSHVSLWEELRAAGGKESRQLLQQHFTMFVYECIFKSVKKHTLVRNLLWKHRQGIKSRSIYLFLTLHKGLALLIILHFWNCAGKALPQISQLTSPDVLLYSLCFINLINHKPGVHLLTHGRPYLLQIENVMRLVEESLHDVIHYWWNS